MHADTVSAAPFAYTFGIEEEFFLVDPDTRELVNEQPPGFARVCKARLGEHVHDELLRAQVELSTPILHSASQARQALAELRAELGRIAEAHDLRLLAAGTHPLAAWQDQLPTPHPRYDRLIDDFQIIGRRNLLCGLHVHVAVPPAVDRVQLMNRLMPWLPALLALSTSSPFWDGRRTGLLSYRQAAYDEWPRSGIPDAFADESDYAAFVSLLKRSGALNDGGSLWWAIRPSGRYPTLELRITDACTRISDALALAAAFRCLVRAHVQNPQLGLTRSTLTRRIIDENRWRAKRYGIAAEFIDEHLPTPVSFAETLQRFSQMLAPHAIELDCVAELAQLRWIQQFGTSAHSQVAIYRNHRERCLDARAALLPVVDWLIACTADESADAVLPGPRASSHDWHRKGVTGIRHILDPVG